MTTLLRISILTLFLSFGQLNVSQAQEKYEYATVQYFLPGANTKGLHVSVSGKAFEKIDVKKDELASVFDYTVLLNYVQAMTDKGWRVMNSFSTTPSQGAVAMTFVLERKTTE